MRFTERNVFLFFFAAMLVFLPAFPAFAAAAAGDIDKIINNYSKMGGFESSFRQTKKLVSVGMELKGSGVLSVRGKNIHWQVKDPAPLSVKISPEEISVSGPSAGSGNQAQQTQTFSLKEGVAGSQIAASVRPFLELFSGSAEALRKQFSIAKEYDGFALTPADAQLPIKKLTVVPDPGQQYIARVVILEKSGDFITYEFEKPVALGSP